MEPVTPALQVSGAVRSFGPRRALDALELALAPGEIYALLGPNGAGKTTLVRAICGRVALDAGRVSLGSEDPRRSPAVRRRLGLVPQAIALYAELTARENLEVLGCLAGLPHQEARRAAGEALEWIGLTSRAASPVRELSGGMQRRVNLAAGVLHRPDVLLLDEPTAGLDPAARERVHELLRELRVRGLAILLATHDLDQAAELADRIGIIVDGRIRAEGTLAALVAGLGEERELVVALSQPPDEDARARLAGEGLVASADGRTWVGPLRGGLGALANLGARLAAGSVRVAEVRVREPGLRGVFFRIAGQELTS
jgi:ABC-2 type transport system ATP-binding protein